MTHENGSYQEDHETRVVCASIADMICPQD